MKLEVVSPLSYGLMEIERVKILDLKSFRYKYSFYMKKNKAGKIVRDHIEEARREIACEKEKMKKDLDK